jgi:Ca2+-binding RTX toxin-like protein
MSPVDATTFYDAVTNDDPYVANGRFQYLVSLLGGNVVVNGGPGNDGIEVGTGNNTVHGNGGNDTVFEWHSGNLSFDAGSGASGTLSFISAFGPLSIDAPTGAVINLMTGTGTNPYGGSLTLTNVDNIVGTDKADYLVGNNRGDIFGDGVYDIGPDTIMGGAGNDIVNLAEGSAGTNADGAGGINTLAVNLNGAPATSKLDLLDQSKNAGIFQNDVLANFQIFVHGTGFYAQSNQNFIFIDNHQPRHTVEAIGQTNDITFHGGNDTLVLHDTLSSGYSVHATGAGGRNTLDLGDRLLDGKNTFDFAKQTKNTGLFAHVTFTKVEAITGAHLIIAPTDGELVVIGGAGPESITGTYKGDDLKAGGGNDTMDGLGGDNTLVGGPGKDVFVFDSSLRPRQHTSSITDFVPSRDKLELDKTIFLGIGHNGVLAPSHFDTGPHAHRGSDRIIYDPGGGGLFYHAPGTPLGHEVEFAILAKHLALTHADFFVV